MYKNGYKLHNQLLKVLIHVEKRSTVQRLGFISGKYNDMNLEKIGILNYFQDNVDTIGDFQNG